MRAQCYEDTMACHTESNEAKVLMISYALPSGSAERPGGERALSCMLFHAKEWHQEGGTEGKSTSRRSTSKTERRSGERGWEGRTVALGGVPAK